jgi:transcriptional regulator with XRE-family HTH domain
VLEAAEIRRRLRAARELRGMSRQQLAALVKEEGFGLEDVARVERGELVLLAGLRRSLAIHLGLPEAWFTEPDVGRLFASDPAASGDRLTRLEEKLDQLMAEQRPDPEELAQRVAAALRRHGQTQSGTGSTTPATASQEGDL